MMPSAAHPAVLDFPPDSALRATWQPDAARMHPGKLHLGFLAHLLTTHIAPGSTLLDPMAGAGSLLYATLQPWGCHVLLNELEGQWVQAARQTWAQMQATRFDVAGSARIRWGDARTLPARLRARVAADALLCSPPYGSALDGWPPGPALQRHWAGVPGAYVQGGYDALLSSPPYGPALQERGLAIGAGLRAHLDADPRTGQGSLLYRAAYDALLCSPPYLDALSPQRHFGGAEREYTHGSSGGAKSREALRRGYDPAARGKRTANPLQIGNLAGKRYTAAMAEVYAACVPLVKPGGLVILILKNIVRDNQEVDLVSQAAGQLVALGCTPVTIHWRKVPPAAFHNIRRKQNKDALVIDREAALVYRTPEVGG